MQLVHFYIIITIITERSLFIDITEGGIVCHIHVYISLSSLKMSHYHNMCCLYFNSRNHDALTTLQDGLFHVWQD